METATPPERPGGRASAERKFFLGFSGWSDVKKAGEVVENLGRAVLDKRVPPQDGARERITPRMEKRVEYATTLMMRKILVDLDESLQ